MKKLIKGIVDFRQKVRPDYRETFARLALGQSPDTLFIACSDSRVVPNLFASTDPGDLFVIRNVGGLIPCCGTNGHSTADESEAAAIEFALLNLSVSNIIVCGHSECGAMNALIAGREKIKAPNLRAWLRHGEPPLKALPVEEKTSADDSGAGGLSRVNRLSQLNVLHQMENLRSYPVVRERLRENKVKIHGWWFELHNADVYAFDQTVGRFILIDEEMAERTLPTIL